MKKILSLSILLLASYIASNAQDRVFGHTYQSNVLPADVVDLELWTTLRSGKQDYFNAFDHRIEFEVGLGKNIQTSIYFNHSDKTALKKINDSTAVFDKSTSSGFSNEWKFKLSDPVANKIGTALYAEITGKGREWEFEGKLIFDKKIGQNLFAINLIGEYEIETELHRDGTEFEEEFPIKVNLAYLRFVGKKAGIGVEAINRNVIAPGEGWEHSVWFAGPVFHFHGDRWFINVNVIPQWMNMKKEKGVTDHLVLTDYEKIESRAIISYSF